MRPSHFTYVAPSSVAEVCAELAGFGADARLIAGGQSLAPLLNMRLVRPRVLVDIGRAEELRYVHRRKELLAVGAGTSQRELERDPLLKSVPVLATVLKHIGSVPTRNRGTVGGSIAYADPVAELPLALVTLDGSVTARSTRGTREIAGRELFCGPFTTALAQDELLTEVRFPVTGNHTAVQFEELTLRAYGDAAIVAVMAVVEMQNDRCERVEIGLSGVADRPLLVSQAAAEVLVGSAPTAALLDASAQACTSGLNPPDDLRASGAYKRRVATTLVRRTLERAFADLMKGKQL
ncbi:MAG TPA: FAD binding domain-containing protein [Herpetosiphonaceae bacterium]